MKRYMLSLEVDSSGSMDSSRPLLRHVSEVSSTCTVYDPCGHLDKGSIINHSISSLVNVHGN